MRRSPPAVAALLALGAALACRQAEPAPRPVEASPEREARELVARARREVESAPPPPVAVNGRVYVPTNLPSDARVPLLVFLHGLGGSGRELVEWVHLPEVADTLGFAFIAPDGMLDRSGTRFWNAGDVCCNFNAIDVDHVAELRRWIGQATADPHVDARRVYVIGFSNGGFMAYRAACELGSLLAGIVSIAGAGPSDTTSCHPDRKLSVVQIHGDRDGIVKFDGGHLFADTRRPRYPSAEKSLQYWAKFDGCSGEAQHSRDLDLDPRVPGAETAVSSYPGCSEHRVELWKMSGGEHATGLSRFSLAAIWEFIVADRAIATAPDR
jgi:polyhydroxybutyrate depolymerase